MVLMVPYSINAASGTPICQQSSNRPAGKGGRVATSGWIGVLVLAIGVVSGCATDYRSPEPAQPYLMTLEILAPDSPGALGPGFSCGDVFSRSDFYATALRRDRKAEAKYDRVRAELNEARSEIEAINERIVPLERRETASESRSDDHPRELEELRARRLENRREHYRKLTKRLSKDERESLERDLAEPEASVRRLEDTIPLSDEEVGVLRDQRQQRTLLAARTSSLRTRAEALRNRIRMTTPGSLRVYPNDSVRIRLMEEDVGIRITPAVFDWSGDDVCATWRLRLNREILANGGVDLEKRDRLLLRVSVRPVSP